MKKILLALSLLFVSMAGYSQNKDVENRNEFKVGLEMPVAGMPRDGSIRSVLSQGISVRYMHTLWGNLSLGIVGGAHFYNQISETEDESTSLYTYTYSYKNYYLHALLHYKVVNKEHFVFALSGSAGLGYVNNRERSVLYSKIPTPFIHESVLTEVGKEFHYLFGAEVAYRFTPNLSLNLEYKYDVKNTNHVVGIGLNYGF